MAPMIACLCFRCIQMNNTRIGAANTESESKPNDIPTSEYDLLEKLISLMTEQKDNNKCNSNMTAAEVLWIILAVFILLNKIYQFYFKNRTNTNTNTNTNNNTNTSDNSINRDPSTCELV